jgi:hypothetical protein
VGFLLLLGRVYDDKDVQERIVRRSKLDWVIVRPVILTDGPKTNAYRALVDPRGWTCGFISRNHRLRRVLNLRRGTYPAQPNSNWKPKRCGRLSQHT